MKNKSVLIFVFCLTPVIVSLIYFLSCRNPNPQSYASLHPETEYVGMETCRQCHADVFETFMHTGMGQSFDEATRSKSAADFSGHQVVYDTLKDFYYHPYWQDDSLYILEFRLAGKDTVYQRREKIDFIVGSGQHTNSHIIQRNGYLFQAPLTFYTQKGMWDLPPGFENGNNSRFSRIIGLECMTCHNAFSGFVKGSENKFLHVKNGIDCERCHGPGSLHVKEKREGKMVNTSTEIDYTIVNPAKLPVDLQFDVCQRCHIQGNAVLNEGMSFFDYRPGMKLSDVMNVFMPVYEGAGHEHIMASHAERLKMSKCFVETVKKISDKPAGLKPYKDGLTCVTCHHPHVSVRKTDTRQFNISCIRCHSSGDERSGCTAEIALLKIESFNCVKCHMPASGATDIPHVRVTDHYIRKPVTPSEQEQIKKFAGIAAINNPQAPAWSRGMAFIQYYERFGYESWALDSAAHYFPARSPKEIEKNIGPLIHLHYLKKNYRQIIEWEDRFSDMKRKFSKTSYDNRDAWTCYRIGHAFEQSGNAGKAVEYYNQAVQLAPLYADFQMALAGALTAQGDSSKAIAIYEAVLKEQPTHVRALTNCGFLLLSVRQDANRARFYYEKAIALDPDYLPAQYNLAGLFLFENKKAEAIRLLTDILNRFPQQQKARLILESLKPVN